MSHDSSRVEAVFRRAADLPAAERSAFLDRECGGDAGLRQRVDELLAAPESGTVAYHSATSAGLASGDLFAGRYKLLERIGEGGMGVVFAAEQLEPVRRRVALKVIRAGADSERLLARFEQERQALALMDHPNIAKVFDAGIAGGQGGLGGVPYFVMELVKGVSMTKYCDEARLTPRQRLDLFVPVCQAVQHAHQKGIIHRDLKPSNILVGLYDGVPVPKVIDFGVAKATGPRLTDHTVYTELGTMVGTLEYMSPEQAEPNNLDVDTRTDVYALGTILYELLTGGVPFSRKELQAAGAAEMLRIIKEREPARPSTRLSSSGELPGIAATRRTEPRRLAAMVRGELDWIVMKCLEKDRTRRYATANGLARDVERYLADEAVEACPPTAGYRLRKFARRHRRALLTGGTVALLLLAAAAVSAWQAVRATAAQRRIGAALAAESAARRREREALDNLTDESLKDLFARSVRLGDGEKAYLQKVLQAYRDLAATPDATPEAREAEAEGHFRVGRIRELLGEGDQALEDYRTAIRLYDALAADAPGEPAYRWRLCRTHRELGKLLATTSAKPAARAELQTAVRYGEELVAQFPDDPRFRFELGRAYISNGLPMLVRRDEWADGAATFGRARELFERLAAESPGNAEYRASLASAHENQAILAWYRRDMAEADAAYRQALALRETNVAEAPSRPINRDMLARTLYNLGTLYATTNKPDAAVVVFRRAEVLKLQLAAEFPADAEHRFDLAGIHNNLGESFANQNKLSEAEAELRQAVAIKERLVADFPKVSNYRFLLANSQASLGGVLFNEQKYAEAQASTEAALSILTAITAEDPTNVNTRTALVLAWRNMANGHDKLGRFAEAAAAWSRVIELSQGSDKLVLRPMRALANAHAGHIAEATDEAAEIIKAALWPGVAWYDFARIYAIASGKDAAKKEEYAARAVEMLRKAIRAGFRDAGQMAKDSDLDPLRARDDFKKLLANLAAAKP